MRDCLDAYRTQGSALSLVTVLYGVHGGDVEAGAGEVGGEAGAKYFIVGSIALQ